MNEKDAAFNPFKEILMLLSLLTGIGGTLAAGAKSFSTGRLRYV